MDHGRAQCLGAQAPAAPKATAAPKEQVRYPNGSGRMLPSRRLLGAPGGAGAAHIIQFRPVGIESPGDELAPEGTDFSERLGGLAAGRRGGGRGWSDACRDQDLLYFGA